MERKTKITAEDGRHDLVITRDFELPVELLFKAHIEADIFEEWMSHEYGKTKVQMLESRKHGGFQFSTTDPAGNVVFQASGVFHDFVADQKIVRTFEMKNSPFDVQLEFLDFEKLTDDTSRLRMNIVYRSGALRDQMLKLPFQHGLNMAHDRLQKLLGQSKSSS